MSEYDAAMAVSGGPGAWSCELSEGWRVGGGLNGGYLLALLGTAARAEVPHRPDPLVVSAYFLSAAEAGPATVRTRVLRDGGSTATLSAELAQAGGDRIAALATYGHLGDLPGDVSTTAREPDLPPREQCVPNTLAPPQVRAQAPFQERFEMLFDPSCVGWAMGEPSGRGMLQAWFRLRDAREPDPISLLTVVDVLPPVTFDLGLPGWAPTMELTVHVRAAPAPGWLKVRHETRNMAGGMFEEDCEVWDSAGRLVAQSRQLARQPRR